MTENVTQSRGLSIILPRSTYRAVSDESKGKVAGKKELCYSVGMVVSWICLGKRLLRTMLRVLLKLDCD